MKILIIIMLTLLLSCTKEVDECWICKTGSTDAPWFYKQETVDVIYCGLNLDEIINIEKEGTFTTEVNVPIEYTKGGITSTKRSTVSIHTITKCNKK